MVPSVEFDQQNLHTPLKDLFVRDLDFAKLVAKYEGKYGDVMMENDESYSLLVVEPSRWFFPKDFPLFFASSIARAYVAVILTWL